MDQRGNFFGGAFGGAAFLHYPAALHDEKAVGERPCEVQVLLDDQDGSAQFLAYSHQRIFDMLDDVGLDALGRFIEQEQIGLAGQSAANRQLLLLAP